MALETEGPAPQADRRDMLAEAFDALPQDAAQTQAPSEEAKPDRPRDEHGRFAKTEAERKQEAKDEAAKAPEQVAAPVTTAPVEEAEAPAWRRPPTSWKKDFHDLYGTLDPKMQEYVWERENQMRSGVEPLIPKAKFADEINAAIEPFLPTIRGLGIDPPRAIRGLMEADHQLRNLPYEQKVQYAAQLLGQYGIDLNNMQGVPQQNVADPAYHALQNKLLQLEGWKESFTQQQQEQQEQQLRNEIDAFAQKAEYYEIARPFMVPLLQKAEAGSLQEAYEKVTGPGGVLHDLIAARSQASSQKQTVLQADAVAKSARKAAVSPRSFTPGTPTATNAQDRRSMLAEQFNNVSERL
jgi:hypothetical protein